MKVDIQDVIAALKESESNPDAAVARLNGEAESREAEAEALRQVAGTIRLLQSAQVSTAAAPVETLPSPETTSPPADRPNADGGREADTPEGIEAVRRIMREGGVWTAKTLLVELERRGWQPRKAEHPLAATEAAVSRLYRVKQELERVGRGEYRYKAAPGSPASTQEIGMFARRAEP